MFGRKEVNVDRVVKEVNSVKPVYNIAKSSTNSSYQEIIISYITKEQWRGFKKQEIEESLKKAGWPKHTIEEAFIEAAKHPMHRYRKRILISAAILVGLIIIIFILSSNAIYFVIENIGYIVISIGVAIIGIIVILYAKSRQHGNRKIDEAPQRRLETKPEQYETDIDLLYRILLDKNNIKLSEIMNDFGVSEKHALEWAKILEAHRLAKLKYPTFGEPELVKTQ